MLGAGSFGVLYSAAYTEHRAHGRMAVRQLSLSGRQHSPHAAIVSELFALRHPHLLRMLGTIAADARNPPGVFMEHATTSLGRLLDDLSRHDRPLDIYRR